MTVGPRGSVNGVIVSAGLATEMKRLCMCAVASGLWIEAFRGGSMAEARRLMRTVITDDSVTRTLAFS